MAYEKKEWYSGETITASKLNHIEDGLDELDKSTINLTNNLNSEIQTRTTETTTLKSRVDQIVAPTGEAPSAAEVTDARVGADGKTYDSVGNAIRTQVTNLKSAITYSTETIDDYITGKYINNNADVGAVASLTYIDSSSYACLLIDVKKGDWITISGMGGNAARLWCLVDEDNVVIAKSDANYTAHSDKIRITVDGKIACNFYTSVTPTVVKTSGVLGKIEELVPLKPQVEANTQKLINYFGGTITEAVNLVAGYVDYSTGVLSNYDSANKYKRTEYIEIPSGVSQIQTNCIGNASGGWAVYDENHTYITGAQTTTINVESTYKYIALSSFDSTGAHANKTISFIYESMIEPLTISCWGDSITEGMFLDGNHSAEYGKAPYPAQLNTIMTDNGHKDFTVNNYGHGGECMPDVMSRLGAVCAIFGEDVTVPGDGTAVVIGTHAESGGLRTDSKIQIPFKNKNGANYNVALTQLSHDTNPVTINGNQFSMSISSQTIYLGQQSGASITIPKGSLMFTANNRNSTIDIVYVGVNDSVSMTLEIYLKFMAKVAEKNPKYLCIGCQNALFTYWSDLSGTVAEKYEAYSEACTAQMGVHFVDLYQEFYPVAMKYALEGGYFSGKTVEELAAMEALLAQKIMPAEFSYDDAHQGNVHLNAAGYYVMARIIYNRLAALNYI